jgi:hypothetical protein
MAFRGMQKIKINGLNQLKTEKSQVRIGKGERKTCFPLSGCWNQISQPPGNLIMSEQWRRRRRLT